MSFHRFLAPATLAVVLVMSGCADDRAADPEPVTTRPGSTTTTTTGSSTTSAVTTTSAEGVTTTVAPPPVTKPLTTAPPSELLIEVTAAYDAAYAAFLSAERTMDEDFPELLSGVAGNQLDSIRDLFRRSRADGIHGEANTQKVPWRRIERLDRSSPSLVALEVCRFDNIDAVDEAGYVVSSAERAYRYVESMNLVDGRWKWVGREWVDESSQYSDCASPS